MTNKRQISWKKGKTKKDYPKLSNCGVKKGYKYPSDRVAWNKGLPAWNRGKTKEEYPQLSNSGVKKGSISPNKGKTLSKEWREKLSLAHIGIYAGEKHPNWRGGITVFAKRMRKIFKYRQWRSDIFTRDNFQCQECGKRGCYLEAHHIESFAFIMEINDIKTYEQAIDCEELWNINNGITYCKKCHNKTKGGRSKC